MQFAELLPHSYNLIETRHMYPCSSPVLYFLLAFCIIFFMIDKKFKIKIDKFKNYLLISGIRILGVKY